MSRPREAAETVRLLKAVGAEAKRLAPEVEDLWWLSQERPRKGEQTRREAPGPRPPADSAESEKRIPPDRDTLAAGSLKAKEVHERLNAAAVAMLTALVDARRLLSAGDGPDTELKGSLLGAGKGNSQRAELGRLRKAQARRQARGDYTPHRTYNP